MRRRRIDNPRGIAHSFGFTATPGIRMPAPPPALRLPLAEGRVLLASAPIRVVSEANQREHHMVKANRTKDQRGAAAMVCRARFGAPPAPPLRIKLTRIAARELDDDNLTGGFKAIRDGIADWLGLKDNNKGLRWEYAQEKGTPKTYEIRIEISRWMEAP